MPLMIRLLASTPILSERVGVVAQLGVQADDPGYATLDKSCRYAGAYPQIVNKIEDGVFDSLI